jgi:hypothetical protein
MWTVSTLVAPDVVGVPLQYFTWIYAAVAMEYRTGYRRNVLHLPPEKQNSNLCKALCIVNSPYVKLSKAYGRIKQRKFTPKRFDRDGHSSTQAASAF